MSDYAWVITKDHLGDGAEGVSGPAAAPPALLGRVQAGEGSTFRLYDGDAGLYYTGRLLTAGVMGSEQLCLAPLADFGAGWAGCTEVRWAGHPEWDCG